MDSKNQFNNEDRRLYLNRENVLFELIDAVLRPDFNHNSKLNVKFINEEAIDASGLTREALRTPLMK